MAREQVTLFGLPIVKNRPSPTRASDPALCRELFITHALVRHEYTTKAPFMAHNQRVQERPTGCATRRARATCSPTRPRSSSSSIAGCRARSSARRRSRRGAARPSSATGAAAPLARGLLLHDEHGLVAERYPDAITVGGVSLPLAYRFDPGEDDDGITVTVPLAVLPQLDPDVMAATIPGWLETKIARLLDELPKALRKQGRRPRTAARRARAAVRRSVPADARALDPRRWTGERVARDSGTCTRCRRICR